LLGGKRRISLQGEECFSVETRFFAAVEFILNKVKGFGSE